MTDSKRRVVNVRVQRRDDTPDGIWNGKVTWHVSETFPLSHLFKGCQLGRGPTEAEAVRDFVRRANLDDRKLQLKEEELELVELRDLASPAESFKPRRCNCENDECVRRWFHSAAGCLDDPAKDAVFGVPKALYVGEVCFRCSQRLPKDYLYPPYGTAKR